MPPVTTLALRFQRIVFALVAGLMLFGVWSYFNLPAREDPEITIREAVVTTRYEMNGDLERELWFDEEGNWVQLRFVKDGSRITFTLR